MGQVYMQLEMERFIELKRAEEENIKLRKALEFYAHENSHFRVDMYAESIAMQDEGEIARQALGGEANG